MDLRIDIGNLILLALTSQLRHTLLPVARLFAAQTADRHHSYFRRHLFRNSLLSVSLLGVSASQWPVNSPVSWRHRPPGMSCF